VHKNRIFLVDIGGFFDNRGTMSNRYDHPALVRCSLDLRFSRPSWFVENAMNPRLVQWGAILLAYDQKTSVGQPRTPYFRIHQLLYCATKFRAARRGLEPRPKIMIPMDCSKIPADDSETNQTGVVGICA